MLSFPLVFLSPTQTFQNNLKSFLLFLLHSTTLAMLCCFVWFLPVWIFLTLSDLQKHILRCSSALIQTLQVKTNVSRKNTYSYYVWCTVIFSIPFHFLFSHFQARSSSGIKHIHLVVQPSPLSISRRFSSSQTLSPLTLTPVPPPQPLTPPRYFLSPWIWLLYTPYTRWIIQYLPFCDWFILLSTTFSRFTHTVRIPLLFKTE